jgi:diguanylate cyclase (GGDEF)-like protein
MRPNGEASSNLDELVTAVATMLMGVESTELAPAAGRVLRSLVEYFEVDLSFLRFHDTAQRATVLVAEWPPRAEVPDPDPLGVIPFETADPTFAASEHLTDIMIIRPSESADYQERVRSGSGVAAISSAVVPLRAGVSTTGTLGFIKFGDRGWDAAELRALRTIALLLAQMQGRMFAEDQLRHIAHHDELTGLPNRRALLAHLQKVRDAGGHGPRALLFIDVDRLKALNDFLGHEAGDRFIHAVADRLRSVVDPADVVARLGGDEFVVAIAGQADERRARTVAERIRLAMVTPIQVGGQPLGRTVSVGIAVADPSTTDLAEWLRSADQAVLDAKNRGGNNVVLFTTEMRTREQVRLAVEMKLLSAIREGSLDVAFQPIVDLRSRRTIGVEALVRWRHPTLGDVAPELFVGVAEATNLAGELGAWVLDAACRQFAEWRSVLPVDAAPGLILSVNISPVQLIAGDFVETVERVLNCYGMSGRDLVLEVTEHAMVSDDVTALQTLHGLRGLGVAIAIDDFGTGYSSLAQLKTFPVTTLKIDRGFVRDLGKSAGDHAIVRSIIALAQSFGLRLIAEGVETEAARTVLLEMGCRTAQGYLFSRPVSGDRILEQLAEPHGPAGTAALAPVPLSSVRTSRAG